MSVKVGNVLTRSKLVTSQIQGRSIVASADMFSDNKAVLSRVKNEQCKLWLCGLHSLLSIISGLYNRPEVAAVPSGLSPTPPIIIIVSYPVGTVGSFPGAKQKGHEADHLPPSSAEVKNSGAVPPLPNVSS
jgi:hypothetical protein